VGLVTTTAAIFSEKEAPEALRAKALGRLQSSVSSLHELLEDLLSLARLEAGQEQRHIEPFDAAARLRELCATLEPAAHERGLFLHCEGPETLSVEGDAAKMQRIVQNLALNALKYTASGGVTVSWSEAWGDDNDRWQIRIQDTGPGLRAALATPLGLKLTEATGLARAVEDRKGEETEGPVPDPASPAVPPGSFQPPGEGIGLSIVKRLCELLDAGLEVATAGKGTVFQVVLPRRYSSRAAIDNPGPASRSEANRVGR
jgi:signal transduction histidine kinase